MCVILDLLETDILQRYPWSCRWLRLRNLFPQTLQGNGFSPVWMFWWLTKLFLRLNSFPQISHLHLMSLWGGFGVALGNISLGTVLVTRIESVVGFGQIRLRNPASVLFGKVLVTDGCFVEILPSVGFGEILAAASFGEISLISDIRAWRKRPRQGSFRFHPVLKIPRFTRAEEATLESKHVNSLSSASGQNSNMPY